MGTLPTPEKTWNFDVGNRVTTTGTNGSNQLLRTLKDALKAMPQAWTVWGSHDGAGNFGNGDSVDRWVDNGDLVWTTGNCSWIVLNVPVIGGQMMIELKSSSRQYANTYFSPSSGFGVSGGGGDGSASAPPTATDTQGMSRDGKWGGETTSVSQGTVFHILQSADGECHRVFFYRNNICMGLWLIERPKDPDPVWTDNLINTVYASDGTSVQVVHPTYLSNSATYAPLRFPVGGINTAGVLTYEAWENGTLPEVNYPDDISLEWPITGLGVYATSSGRRGRKCTLYDMWWAPKGNGQTYPDDGTRTHCQMGRLLVPWNGSAVVMNAGP